VRFVVVIPVSKNYENRLRWICEVVLPKGPCQRFEAQVSSVKEKGPDVTASGPQFFVRNVGILRQAVTEVNPRR